MTELTEGKYLRPQTAALADILTDRLSRMNPYAESADLSVTSVVEMGDGIMIRTTLRLEIYEQDGTASDQ